MFLPVQLLFMEKSANTIVNEKLKDNPISNYDKAKILEDVFFKYEKEKNINFVS